jgi:hypothetical protein
MGLMGLVYRHMFKLESHAARKERDEEVDDSQGSRKRRREMV